MICNLVFSNPRLEQHFRKAVQDQHEVGGWLFIVSEPFSWPGSFSYKAVKRALGIGVRFIETVVFARNIVLDGRSYSCWNWDKAREVVAETANAYEAWPLFFHTHPHNISTPSPRDLVFAGLHCAKWSGRPAFCIVCPSPLRLYPCAVSATSDNIESGRWFSWRAKVLREFT